MKIFTSFKQCTDFANRNAFRKPTLNNSDSRDVLLRIKAMPFFGSFRLNEVIASLYYCFWKYNNANVVSNDYFESDLFFCFSNLMAEIKDIFLRELDQEA